MDDTSIKIDIATIALGLFFFFLTIIIGVNRYLLADIYFVVFYIVIVVLLLTIVITSMVLSLKRKYGKQRVGPGAEKQEISEEMKGPDVAQLIEERDRLSREKREVLELTGQLLEKEDRQTERAKELELEEREFELAQQRYEFDKKRVDYVLEAAHQMADLLPPETDPQARAMIVRDLIPRLLHLPSLEMAWQAEPGEA